MKPLILTSERFAPFGDVLRSNGLRATYPATTGHDGSPGDYALTVTRVAPAPSGPISFSRLERHLHTSQTFIPLVAARWLVIAATATADGQPDVAKALAFIAHRGDAICFARSVWHATLTVLDAPAEVIMLMWRAEAGDDTMYFDLGEPLLIEL